MRTFGTVLAITGAILWLTFWVGGLVLLIVGLLLMIASPKESRTKKSKSKQSTGGFAGLAKKDVPQVKYLGIDKSGIADKSLSAGTIALWGLIAFGVVGAFWSDEIVELGGSVGVTSKFDDVAESFSSTSSLGHDECLSLGHYKIQMWEETMNKFCKIEPTPSNPQAKTCTPVTKFLNEEQIKSVQTAINSRHSGEKGTWELWARDAMRYAGQCS